MLPKAFLPLCAIFLPCAQACLEVTGTLFVSHSTSWNVQLKDDGTQTCSFNCNAVTTTCDASCSDGYRAKWTTTTDWRHQPGKLHYDTPHGSYDLDVPVEPGSEVTYNCCGGNVPCQCTQITYRGNFWC
ncbi:hypothetical protein ETB97_002192 [Aspergillus alliaceus]|uniref:Ig-like domain-containing protein n=1 Tax=Petromyces alliaceus TaxID=209559 RepID=A0A5N6FIM0_PETAA|nr:uncharacterized protein BDW43DRAFT_303065 [Aspergillus alliaceus]KAB8229479.1 hypothetical protein BDW43DRAFT_303065 [Aspergillus alliaceus]KAE8391627.1 hypothetical protein BDV23DRAFT_182439 [Aspergillus alliaceus]KAF5859933.1 hypothetical protein ETB97_002192 [Aspergillus burnettii]